MSHQTAIKSLKNKGYKLEEKDVVMVGLPNKVGVLKDAADKLKDAGIDLAYIYGSTCDCACDCQLIFSSDNDDKAIEILSK